MAESAQTQNKELEEPTVEQLDKEIHALSKKLNDLYAHKWQSEMKKYKEWKQQQQQNNEHKNTNKDNKNDNKENQQNNPYFQWFQWFEKHTPPKGQFEWRKPGPHHHHHPNPQLHNTNENKVGPFHHFNPFFMWMEWQQQHQPQDQKDWCPYDGRRGNPNAQGQKNTNNKLSQCA
ncbi:hypothetical protein M9Y10_030189 [Tritrichomonas musculus]|uniref:Uncharacterized protein n=1 Tax=Tritrichomonas musculus TaxID=1915356 RepID=A0ABR2KRC0_9EUKA